MRQCKFAATAMCAVWILWNAIPAAHAVTAVNFNMDNDGFPYPYTCTDNCPDEGPLFSDSDGYNPVLGSDSNTNNNCLAQFVAIKGSSNYVLYTFHIGDGSPVGSETASIGGNGIDGYFSFTATIASNVLAQVAGCVEAIIFWDTPTMIPGVSHYGIVSNTTLHVPSPTSGSVATQQFIVESMPADANWQGSRTSGLSGVYGFYTDRLLPPLPFIVTKCSNEINNVRITWNGAVGKTNIVQVSNKLGITFTNISPNIIITAAGITTNFVDVGVYTNKPVRFYHVKQLP